MDRIISLLAALVGLIALGGAILVHVNGDVQRKELAAEIAELRTAVSSAPIVASAAPSSAQDTGAPSIALEQPSMPSTVAASAETQSDPQSVQIRQLQDRIAQLEQQNRDQASALADAQARLAERASTPELPMAQATPPSSVTSSARASAETIGSAAGGSSESASSISSPVVPAPITGATADCIPGGTRFVGKPGDSFAICKTSVVVKIAAVSDGVATIEGAGQIAAGSFGDIVGKGCSVMVFSADTTGFADLRVTCK